jgi:hypothetical protein
MSTGQAAARRTGEYSDTRKKGVMWKKKTDDYLDSEMRAAQIG